VTDPIDPVAVYATSLGYAVRPKITLVEGTTDVALLQRAAKLESQQTGAHLIGDDLCIIPAGEGDLGGTRGVIRELLCFKGLIRSCILPNGKPKYRVIALFDNDKAGRQALQAARSFDVSLLEGKDLFRLMPVMTPAMNLDPIALRKQIESDNEQYKGLDWEMEDLLPDSFMACFLNDQKNAISHTTSVNGKTHREFTRDGKANLHRFIKIYAIRDDLAMVVEVLKVLRSYFGLK
jgi:hypothetical protein